MDERRSSRPRRTCIPLDWLLRMRQPRAVRRFRMRNKKLCAIAAPHAIEQPPPSSVMDDGRIDSVQLQKDALFSPPRWEFFHLVKRHLVRAARFRDAEQLSLVRERKGIRHVARSGDGVLEIAGESRLFDLSAHDSSVRLAIIEIFTEQVSLAFELHTERVRKESSRSRSLRQPMDLRPPMRLQEMVDRRMHQADIVKLSPEYLAIQQRVLS